MKIQTHGNEHTILLRPMFDPADTIKRPDLKNEDPRGFVINVNRHDPDTGTYLYDTDDDPRLADDPAFKAEIEAELAGHVALDPAVREYQKPEKKVFATADIEAKDERIAELEQQIAELQSGDKKPGTNPGLKITPKGGNTDEAQK